MKYFEKAGERSANENENTELNWKQGKKDDGKKVERVRSNAKELRKIDGSGF